MRVDVVIHLWFRILYSGKVRRTANELQQVIGATSLYRIALHLWEKASQGFQTRISDIQTLFKHYPSHCEQERTVGTAGAQAYIESIIKRRVLSNQVEHLRK